MALHLVHETRTMRRKTRFTGILLMLSIILSSQTSSNTLSEDAEINLLTCQPGNDVYSVFGHSALHVYDPKSSTDLVFNYGVFSFSSDYFIWKFVRGYTDYKLAIQSMDRFKQEYYAEGRWVASHKLNLSKKQKNEIFSFLLHNSRPENAKYRYNFLFENCATRIRDVIYQFEHNNIQNKYQPDYFFAPPERHELYDELVAAHQDNPPYTFRQLLDLYVKDYVWLDFGIDVALGQATDKVAGLDEQMFLPDFLMFRLSNSTKTSNDARFPVISSYKMIVEPNRKIEKTKIPFLLSPTFITLIIFILTLFITILGSIRQKKYYGYDAILFILLGIGGMLVFFISYFSIHPVVRPNLNLLWLHPLHLVYGMILIFIKNKKPSYFYHFFSILLLVVFFFVWIANVQYFHPASIMLAAAILLRNIYNINVGRQ